LGFEAGVEDVPSSIHVTNSRVIADPNSSYPTTLPNDISVSATQV